MACIKLLDCKRFSLDDKFLTCEFTICGIFNPQQFIKQQKAIAKNKRRVICSKDDDGESWANFKSAVNSHITQKPPLPDIDLEWNWM
jgi:hypothetical protein